MRWGPVAIAALALAACAHEPVQPPATPSPSAISISPDAFGDVRIGMSVPEASAALGAELVADMPFDDPNACQTMHETGVENPPLSFMAQDGRIARVTVYEGAPLIRTAEGVGVGSSGAAVRAAYPNAIEESAPYDEPPAHDLIVWAEPEVRGLRFEVNKMGKVVAMHAGGPSILYIEGCL